MYCMPSPLRTVEKCPTSHYKMMVTEHLLGDSTLKLKLCLDTAGSPVFKCDMLEIFSTA